MQIGAYAVEGELGRGGAGVVYRARDASGQQVALKLLLSLPHEERALRRFERELEAVSRLEHPGVVRALDTGRHQGKPFLVMQLVEGETLERRLARAGWYPPRQAAELALALAQALVHAHDRDVLHRDLKPENVLLQPDGSPLLTDFGLTWDMAATRHSLTQTGIALGTPGYWSPEQATGELAQVGPATDVYGLGATLYAALTGRPPIEAKSLAEILAATTTQAPIPPSRRNEGVDPELESICLRCLEKDPGDRYGSAQRVADALEGYLQRAAPRPRGSAPLVAGAVLVIGALGAGLLLAGVETAPTPAPRESAPAVPDATSVLALAAAKREGGDLDGALALLDELVESLPDHLAARRERAKLRAIAGDQSGAMADVARVLELDPSDAVAWRIRGSSLLMLGELDEGLAAYDRALELDPSEARAWAQRAVVLRLAGRVDEARDDLRQAIHLDPTLAQAHAMLGDLEVVAEQWESAIPHLRKALRLDPQDHVRRLNLAVSLHTLGRPQDALTELDLAAAGMPENPAVWQSRASARLALNRVPEAVEDLTRAIELEETVERYVDRAECYWALERLPETEADLTSALAIEPDPRLRPSVLASRGQLRWALGKTTAALGDLRESQRLRPNGYTAIWLALLGDAAPQEEFLSEPSWPSAIARWAAGQLPADELLRQAEAGPDPAGQRCEAACYLGLQAEVAGDRALARQHYEQAVATGRANVAEWTWSSNALRRLR